MRAVEITTASFSASAPPDRPVPAPRGTNGMPRARERAQTANDVSSVSRGSTTARGGTRYAMSPSDS